MIQLHQRPLLDARDVAAADAKLLGDLPLRPLLAAVLQAEPAAYDLLLPFIENVEMAVDFFLLDLELHLIHHIIRFGSQDVDQRDFIALFVRTDRIMKRYVLA